MLEGASTRGGRVSVVDVTKSFGGVTAVNSVSLDVEAGEFLTLLGPSGCGKTTLMRMIAGFEDPTSGRILIDQSDVTHAPPEARPSNMVFQRYALFPHLSVAENIAYGLVARGLEQKEIRRRVSAALDLVHMQDFASRSVRQLSGGQSQRVALARALVNEPKVLLLDEPLSALDLQLRNHMQVELRSIHRQLGTTFLFVTHDQGEALAMSIDPRTVSPLDEDTILESVEKTGRLIVVDEAYPRCNIGKEIAAVVAGRAFEYLRAPIEVISPPHVPVPFAPELEDAFIPNAARVADAARNLVRWKPSRRS